MSRGCRSALTRSAPPCPYQKLYPAVLKMQAIKRWGLRQPSRIALRGLAGREAFPAASPDHRPLRQADRSRIGRRRIPRAPSRGENRRHGASSRRGSRGLSTIRSRSFARLLRVLRLSTHEPIASAAIQEMPRSFRLFRAAASDPPTSMARHVSSITKTGKPSPYASSAE
jgi:hypothetical protein